MRFRLEYTFKNRIFGIIKRMNKNVFKISASVLTQLELKGLVCVDGRGPDGMSLLPWTIIADRLVNFKI